MKTTKEIVEHLRNGLGSWLLLSRDIERCNSHELLCLAAASEIERLEKEVAELREEIIDRKAALAVERSNVELLSHKIDELRTELDGALATMMAAAVEIQEHWDAHCDVDGYGPANLMRRLEKGFCNAGYGYSANTVVELTNEIEQLRTKLDRYTRRSESGESLGDALDMAEEIEQLRAENAELRAKLDEAYERAAKVCEPWNYDRPDDWTGIARIKADCAKAIRALKEKP